MNLYDLLLAPFAEFDFMRYALASVFCLSLSAAPVGVFLVMRRMSLIGDALSHAVLPGAAVGYMFAGLSLPAMGLGGVAAGMLMALLAGLVSRFTTLKEDANFAAFYLSSLAIGVVLVSKTVAASICCICFSALYLPSIFLPCNSSPPYPPSHCLPLPSSTARSYSKASTPCSSNPSAAKAGFGTSSFSSWSS